MKKKLYNVIYINRLNAVKLEAIKDIRSLVLDHGVEGHYGELNEHGNTDDADDEMKKRGYTYKKVHIPAHFYLNFDLDDKYLGETVFGVHYYLTDGTPVPALVKEVRVFNDKEQTIHVVLHDEDPDTDGEYITLDRLSVEEWANLYAVLGTYIGETLMKK